MSTPLIGLTTYREQAEWGVWHQRADLLPTQYAAAVATRYQERFDTPMSEPAAMAFTATLTLAMALDAAGDTAAPAVRAALRQLSVPATRMIVPWTGIQFGENGQNELAAAVVREAQ